MSAGDPTDETRAPPTASPAHHRLPEAQSETAPLHGERCNIVSSSTQALGSHRSISTQQVKRPEELRKQDKVEPPYSVGGAVEVLYDDGIWWPGVIEERQGENKWRISFDDGEEIWTALPADDVRPRAPQQPGVAPTVPMRDTSNKERIAGAAMKAQGSDAAGHTVKVLRPQDKDKNRTAFYNWFMRTECARLKEVHGANALSSSERQAKAQKHFKRLSEGDKAVLKARAAQEMAQSTSSGFLEKSEERCSASCSDIDLHNETTLHELNGSMGKRQAIPMRAGSDSREGLCAHAGSSARTEWKEGDKQRVKDATLSERWCKTSDTITCRHCKRCFASSHGLKIHIGISKECNKVYAALGGTGEEDDADEVRGMLEEKKAKGEAMIGWTVEKPFPGHGVFKGRVTGFRMKNGEEQGEQHGFYHIVFDGQHEEEIPEHELARFLVESSRRRSASMRGSRRPFSQEPTQASEFIKQIFSASPPLPPPPREPTVMSPLGPHRVQEWVVPSTTAVDPAATAKNISSTDFYNWFMKTECFRLKDQEAKQRLIRSSLSFGDRKVKAQANFQKLTPEEKIVLKARAAQEINMERRQAKRPRLPGADVSASGFGADSLAAGPVDVDGPLRGDRAYEALKSYFNRNVSE